MTISSHVPVFGLWRTTSLVIGNIVGSGIFLLPASLAVFGTLGLFGWVVTSLGAVFLALVFARLAQRMPKIGGPYAYSRTAFGDFVGFQVAWSYWIGAWASNAGIATAFASYMTVFFPELGQNASLAFFVSAASVWLFTFLNMASLKTTGAIQLVIVVLKIIPLMLIGLFGMFYIKLENFLPINPSNLPPWTAVASAAALTLYAFLGLESGTVPAENVIDPHKTIPRATILGTLISAAIYIWTTVVLMGVMPAPQLANSKAPFAEGGVLMFGSWAGPVIAACAALSAFGTLNGWILVQAQVPLAAARDGLFPKAFKKLSKAGTPVFGLVISSLLMTAMLALNYQSNLVDQFTAIVQFTTFAVLLPYLYSAVAELYFILTDPNASKKPVVRHVLIALLGFSYTILIVVGAGKEAVFLGMIFVFSGFPVYAFMKRGHKP